MIHKRFSWNFNFKWKIFITKVKEFNPIVLDLLTKRRFPHDYSDSFEIFKEGLYNIDNLIIHWLNIIFAIKIMGMLKNVWKAFKTNTRQGYHDLYLKVELLFTCVFQTFIKNPKILLNWILYNWSTCGYSLDMKIRSTNVDLKLP